MPRFLFGIFGQKSLLYLKVTVAGRVDPTTGMVLNISDLKVHLIIISQINMVVYVRGGQKHKSQKSDGCPINSHFIGLGLLRTVFEIVVACREGPVPEFCYIAGDIGGGFPKIVFGQ